MGKYFGTDGIRGVANETLDAKLAFDVGVAAATVLAGERKPRFVIGMDTRISGDMLESAISAGLCSAGADVVCLGTLPTPGVAFIASNFGFDAGIVISASHNPYEHNGIKIFSGDGLKLSDELEAKIEESLDSGAHSEPKRNGDIGRVSRADASGYIAKYIEHIRGSAELGPRRLKVLIDCANGAASRTAREVFSALPVDAEFISDEPNGVNINDGCGSTDTKRLRKLVVKGGFDIGIAFDGDADRCLAVDEKGGDITGDMIMAVCAMDMREHGHLKNNAIAVTVMSNLGLHIFAREQGIRLHVTTVGDRFVLECMQKEELCLGGEQSGHIIFTEDSTTGDGQLAAVKLLSVLSRCERAVSEQASVMINYPQVLRNIPIDGGNDMKQALMDDEVLRAEVSSAEAALGESGRILVRQSGTEALIRVMVEADTEERALGFAQTLANFVELRMRQLLTKSR